MNLSSIKASPKSTKKRLRVARGRGTGIGGTSGRGMNGQNARTGKGKRYATFEWGQTRLFMRTPKLRGFTAYAPKEYVTVNLSSLEKLAIEGISTIDYAVLYERKIIRQKGMLLKVLGSGSLTKSVQVTADAVSAGAKTSIEKVWGSITTI